MAEFIVTIDGEDHALTEANHTVAMFRQTPEYDYLHIRPEDDPVDEQRNILVFRQQYLCHWLADLALNGEDRRTLEETTQKLGVFQEQFGFNSRVLLEDRANEFEIEYYTQGLMSDLNGTDTVPEGWA